ncbi:MAG: hypothetical protein J0M10_06260 [Chitinophagales bacterium]|nr:hypothetical protein [Chitinophagales bacterium]
MLLPGGLILPGYFLGGFLLIVLIALCLIITAILLLIFRKSDSLTLFAIITTLAFLVSHYFLYSPTLKIIVPKGYTGQVTLLLSTVDENMLTLDSNGIGYVTRWTFKKTWTPPAVFDSEGRRLDKQCVGFNPSTFWAKGYSTSSTYPGRIDYLSFEIVPEDKTGQKQYYDKEIFEKADKTKLPQSE